MITLTQARDVLSAQVESLPEIETLALSDALSRTLAQDVHSTIAVPPADNSAMDGFAIATKELANSQTEFLISQRVPAGVAPQPLTIGTVARIFTGGEVPAGADAVVIQENCEFDTDSVKLLNMPNVGDNIRRQGQDIEKGALVVSKGKILGPVELACIASVGIAEVAVYRRLKVAIFSTGDELVEPGQPLLPGQIYNSNRTMLKALCEQLGFETIDCGIVEDTLAATKKALKNAAEQADVILSSGGVSVGEEDYIKPAIEELGEITVWKVQMKPGKPVVWGKLNTASGKTPILGLPGNPVSSFVTFQLLGLPLLRAIQGQNLAHVKSFRVVADFDRAKVTREEYIRVKLATDASGVTRAVAHNNQSSGVLTSLAWADGLVRQQIDETIRQGEPVEFLPLRDGVL